MFVCVGLRPIHLAVDAGHIDIVSSLIERGCNVSEPSFDGTTPLHIACECGHLAIVSGHMLLTIEVRHVVDCSSFTVVLICCCEVYCYL